MTNTKAKEILKKHAVLSDELYGDGDYHPYGWDWVTLHAVNPKLYNKFLDLKKEAIEANDGKPVNSRFFP